MKLHVPLAAALVALHAATLPAFASAPAAPAAKAPPLAIQSAYPVVVTDRMAACRDFYVKHFGFEVHFEASWFVFLGSGATGIAFMTPDHPSRPPGPERFSGRGLFLTLQVADAAYTYRRVRDSGAKIAYPLKDEAWGQRRFGVVDPSGLWLDVVQQTEPAPGYWDRYKPR